jgi:hypothetical protein
MEQGDPRWQQWWDAFPRKERNLVAKAVKRVLDAGQRPIAEEGARRQHAMGPSVVHGINHLPDMCARLAKRAL